MCLFPNDSIIARRKYPASILAPNYHGNNPSVDRQRNETTDDKHILKTTMVHPRRDGKRNANAKGIAHEGNCSESVTGDLCSLDEYQLNIQEQYGTYLAIAVYNKCQDCVADTAETKTE